MSHNETHTLQLWPCGYGYEYWGNPDPQVPTHRLRRQGLGAQKQERWRKGTKAEWEAILVEVRVQRYIEHEVLKCDSMLVTALMELDGVARDHEAAAVLNEWGLDSVTNLSPDPSEWDAKACQEWLYEQGHEDEAREIFHAQSAEAFLGAIQDAVRDHAEAAEIFEWWAVTEWLARQLIAIGEPVLDNAYGQWWGRTCTGQAMKMDGTLQRVARSFA